MFNPKAKTNTMQGSVSISIISADAVIKGDIQSQGDIRIDGKLIGNVHCQAKIIVGKEGRVEGNLTGSQAEILGYVKGSIRMSGQLNLNDQAVVHGDVHVAKLKMDNTVVFNGKCTMGETQVQPQTVENEPQA